MFWFPEVSLPASGLFDWACTKTNLFQNPFFQNIFFQNPGFGMVLHWQHSKNKLYATDPSLIISK